MQRMPASKRMLCFSKKCGCSITCKKQKDFSQKPLFSFVLLRNQGKIAIEQRTEKDIWHKLYQFPLTETLADNEEEVFDQLVTSYPDVPVKKLTTNSIRHKLSHQQLHIDFYEIEINTPQQELHFVNIEEIENYAFPIVLWNFIKEYLGLRKN